MPVLRRDLLLVPPHGVVPRAAPTRRPPVLLGGGTAANTWKSKGKSRGKSSVLSEV